MTFKNGIENLDDVLSIEEDNRTNELPSSTYDMIKKSALENPQAKALSFIMSGDDYHRSETWTYQSLLEAINQTANFFNELGADKDTVIAYILPNLPETHFVIWGGEATGIVTAINPLLEPAAIADLLNAAEVKILVTLGPFPGSEIWSKIFSILNQIPSLMHLVLINVDDRVTGYRKIFAKMLRKKEQWRTHGYQSIKAAIPHRLSLHKFSESIRRQNKLRLNSTRIIQPDDCSSYFCTGGTTGLPKIAMRTHRNEVFNAWSVTQLMNTGVGVGKTLFCGLPLFHVNAALITGLVPFSSGAHVVLGTPQGYRGKGVINNFWKLVEEYRINFFSGVPTLYSALLEVPINNSNITSLEYGLCGAAPMPVEVFRVFQERTGLKILEGYGLTEATCVSSCNPPLGKRQLGSVGLRIPGQAMKTVLLDDDGNYIRDCAPNETGVIAISGPNVFKGYKNSKQNIGLWIHTGDKQKWLNSGDLGKQDMEGYFWLTGRRKELIIRGGHNIDPALIEEPLHRHPDIQVAAAIGRPDIYAGEVPVVYVQLKQNSQLSEEDISSFAKQEITERAAWPKYTRIVNEIPLTAVGKIFKPMLKRIEISRALEEELLKNGISVDLLEAIDDKSRGIIISVTLDKDKMDAAQKVLGAFAYPVEYKVK